MSLSGKPETKDGALSTDRQRVQGSPESSCFEERLKRSLLRTLMKLKKDKKLKLFQSHLSQDYPECIEREQRDPEALYIVEKMLETCGSERSLKITLHILRNMKQKDLTASLERDEQHNESIKRAQQTLKTDLKRKFEFIFEEAEIEDNEKWTENLIINSRNVTFKLDTGAECNVMSEKTFSSLDIRGRLKASNCKLVTYSGHKMAPLGKKALTCQFKGQKHRIEFEIIQQEAPAILGRATCQKLGMVKRLYDVRNYMDMLKDFDDLFTGVGCLPAEHHIKIDPTVKPAVHAPRRIPVNLRDRVNGEFHRMEQMGVIVKQTEPTEWVNSMVTVVTPKKIRICMDPKDLNQAIQREHYPLLTVEEMVSRMPNAKYFSVLDANQGFCQIKLDDESYKLCTMNAPIGRYRFLRLPFGVSSASEVFQRSIVQMIEGLDGVVNIIDDLLVWGDTEEEHDRRLRSSA
ncbi:hypothetical protein SKAU_G00153170 [Synaphobranchus kaupii]|uniref:ribonuclease H n=1 Tax=Synaphobranchus kaupii TaxID=118154 RepID=A0A9Q1FH22_SYNKA|nr:hypothetical protein SKAU_G00153170 [Synaphobranchus kaupii]